MSDLGAHTFTMTDKDSLELLRIDDSLSARAFPKILFRDSILDFYPHADIHIRDKQGVISEKLFMIEGLHIETKLGRDEIISPDPDNKDILGGYLVNQYGWAKHDIAQIEIKNHIAGDYLFMLIPVNYFKDAPDTKAYNDTISNVVKKVVMDSSAMDHKEFDSKGNKKIFIGETKTDKNIWYQAGRLSRYFLESLASRAVSKTYANSPYYTFLNNKGEFYFMSASEMLSQAPICNYRIEETVDSVKDPFVIKAYSVQSGGSLISKINYNKRFHKIKSDGTSPSEDIGIESYKQRVDGSGTLSSKKDKLLILKNGSLGITSRITSIDNFGLFDDKEDNNIYTAWKNNFYIDSALPYRLIVQIFFNPKLCAGKVITLTVNKIIEDAYASEYSGAWLILESRVNMDIEGFPVQQLLIGKAGVAIDSNHPALNKFI